MNGLFTVEGKVHIRTLRSNSWIIVNDSKCWYIMMVRWAMVNIGALNPIRESRSSSSNTIQGYLHIADIVSHPAISVLLHGYSHKKSDEIWYHSQYTLHGVFPCGHPNTLCDVHIQAPWMACPQKTGNAKGAPSSHLWYIPWCMPLKQVLLGWYLVDNGSQSRIMTENGMVTALVCCQGASSHHKPIKYQDHSRKLRASQAPQGRTFSQDPPWWEFIGWPNPWSIITRSSTMISRDKFTMILTRIETFWNHSEPLRTMAWPTLSTTQDSRQELPCQHNYDLSCTWTWCGENPPSLAGLPIKIWEFLTSRCPRL